MLSPIVDEPRSIASNTHEPRFTTLSLPIIIFNPLLNPSLWQGRATGPVQVTVTLVGQTGPVVPVSESRSESLRVAPSQRGSCGTDPPPAFHRAPLREGSPSVHSPEDARPWARPRRNRRLQAPPWPPPASPDLAQQERPSRGGPAGRQRRNGAFWLRDSAWRRW